MSGNLNRNQHSVYILTYHLVLVIKYRRKVINDDIFDLLMVTPIPSPRGCIEMVEPIVNKLIPIISISVPNTNKTRIPDSIGAKVTLSSNTSAAIGNTELTDSPIAPRKCLTLNLPSLFVLQYIIETLK